MTERLSDLRRDYVRRQLRLEDLHADPIVQFRQWLDDAMATGAPDPNAMSLATATAEGETSLRTVLLKGYSHDGFVFFTNLDSAKAQQIAANPVVSLLFFWRELERQVSINGTARRLSMGRVAEYFLSRPRESRIAAWVSPQSRVIDARRTLEMKFEEALRRFGAGEIPVPSFWGGFEVAPRTIEYWQGGDTPTARSFPLPARAGSRGLARRAPRTVTTHQMHDHPQHRTASMRHLIGLALAGLVASAFLPPRVDAAKKPKPPYSYYVTGNPADVQTPTTPGTALMGGGTDIDAAFQWMIQRAGGGDFVVIRTTDSKAYNRYIDGLGTVDSVETLVIPTPAAANDPFVIQTIGNAEALFMAGGDQATYVTNWKGTGVETAIAGLVARGVPIGGTSAGLAVLGAIDFAALNGSITSSEALADPYDARVTLEPAFLLMPHLEGTITDSHFVERDRMGRLLVFMARSAHDDLANPVRGIGVDSLAAVLVDAAGATTLVGTGAAYFVGPAATAAQCAPATPLTYTDVPVYRMTAGATFNLATWSGSGGARYAVSSVDGALTSSSGPIY